MFGENTGESSSGNFVNDIFGFDESIKIKSLKLNLKDGLKSFEKNIDYVNLYKERDNLPDVKLEDLYGEYEWDSDSNDDNNILMTGIKLIINKDNLAQLIEKNRNVSESTVGNFTYMNGRVIYVKTKFNDDNKTEYTGNFKTYVFDVIDKDNLELVNFSIIKTSASDTKFK